MNADAETYFERACDCFRERRFYEAMKACDRGLSQSDLNIERRVEFSLLTCDLLQAAGPIDWGRVLSFARKAKRAADKLEEPIRSLREAQALNRIGIAIRALAMDDEQQLDARIAQLESALRHHLEALENLVHLDSQSSQLDQRELHSVIVSAYNNRSSALVEKAYLYETKGNDKAKAKKLLEEALEQFSSCRFACDGLLPEARVAALNDEAEVLLRLSRVCEQDPDLKTVALYRAHFLVAQALELLDEITDPRVLLTWEWLLRAKISYSAANDMNYAGQLARRLAEDSTSINQARFEELSEPEPVRYQIATVDVYYTPWSASRGGGRTNDGPPQVRLDRTVERLRQALSARHRLNSILLLDGWQGLHLEDLKVALDAADELGEAATICEIIETCRAQGYSAMPRQQPRFPGDKVDSVPNRALAAIGIPTVGAPPDLAVQGSSILHQLAEQTIDVDLVRQSTVGVGGWWWSLLRCGGALYWALLTPGTCYSGKCSTSADDEIIQVPSPIVDELARRRRSDDPPLPLVISVGGGLGRLAWATLPVGEGSGHHLVQHADLRIAPPVPLLHACLQRPKSEGPWPITLLVVADPRGDLSQQAALPRRLANLMDGSGIVLQSRRGSASTAHQGSATRAALTRAIDGLRDRAPGGTMVYSGHGITDGRDPIADFGLALDGEDALDREDKLTAHEVIKWAWNADKPILPSRVILAACRTIGVGRSTHEWTSVAPAAMFAGAEVVFATCRDLTSNETNLDATVELCHAVCSSQRPVAALNSLQRSHCSESTRGPFHPSLLYSAVIGQTEL